MASITLFDDLPDLTLIEVFSYLSSFDILWAFGFFNERITLLISERRYFRRVNLSRARRHQFLTLVSILPLNAIESLSIDVDASPLQLSRWPYLPRLKTLHMKGIREFNDISIFVILHAATLTHLTIHTSPEFVTVGVSLKYAYPLGRVTPLIQNIVLRHLPSLQSLDLGTNEYSKMLYWHMTAVSAPLTYMRIVLYNLYDLFRLMSTSPLSGTLHELHVTLPYHRWDFPVRLLTVDSIPRMSQLHTFTFAKSYIWKLDTEWELVEVLTTVNVMPILRRVRLAVVLTVDDLKRIHRCPIFNDSRGVDVHFAFRIFGFCEHINVRECIPRGSLTHPRQIMGSAFIPTNWHNMAYYISPGFDDGYKPQACTTLWYTLPWSFDEFFQLVLPDRYFTQREVCVSPSTTTTTDGSCPVIVNGTGDIFPPPNLSLIRTISLHPINHRDSHYQWKTVIRQTIPTNQMVVLNTLCQLNNCLFTLNLRSIHISLYLPSKCSTPDWSPLKALSTLPLLKSLRIIVYNRATILNNIDCQIIVRTLTTLTDFGICFRMYISRNYGRIGAFDVHCKSILNLRHHIFTALYDRQPTIIIEEDGCGLTLWL